MSRGLQGTPGRSVQDEARLVAAAKGGDPQAFEVLVRRHKDRVLNLAYRIVGDADEANDVTQETLISAFQLLPSFRGRSAFATWLYRITVNAARQHLRSRGRREVRWEKWGVIEAASQVEQTEAGSQQGPLVGLLQELPEKHRVAMALFYLEELSLQEIAGVLRAPVGSVKVWLLRGREKLRCLAEERGVL